MALYDVADLTIARHARTAVIIVLAMIAVSSIVQGTALAPPLVYAINSSALTASSQTAVSASNMTQSVLHITPSTSSITSGDYARFDIEVNQVGVANVLLVAQGVPTDSNAIFAPQAGVANPELHSTLSIVTSSNTPAGNYNVTVVALLNGEEYSAYISLQVSSSSTTSETSSTSSTSRSLSLSVDTDLHVYEPNSTLIVRGQLSDAFGNAVPDATVIVQVDDPTGAQLILENNLTTDAAGTYQLEVKLNPQAPAGTYSVFASSSEPGYASATTHTTFVVDSSLTPSAVIPQVSITDSTGNPSGIFSAGQTIFVWVTVQNNGAQFQGVIWVQIIDPNGTPRSVQLQMSTLAAGTSVKIGFSYTTSINLPRGVYTANALVSDKLISQGGVFLASAKAQFALTG